MPLIVIAIGNKVQPLVKTRTTALPEVTKKDLDLRSIYGEAKAALTTRKLGDLQALLVGLHSSPKVPSSAKQALGVLANQVTGLKETESLFGTASTSKELARVGKGLDQVFEKIALESAVVKPEGRSRQEAAEQRFKESAAEYFLSQNSPEAATLKKMLDTKHFAVGKAPVVFVLSHALNINEVKMHLNAELTSEYLLLKGAYVIGVNQEYVEEKSFRSMKDALQILSTSWNSKQGGRYFLFDSYAPWNHALWALALPKSDVNVLHRASPKGFRPTSWGFGFKS